MKIKIEIDTDKNNFQKSDTEIKVFNSIMDKIKIVFDSINDNEQDKQA